MSCKIDTYFLNNSVALHEKDKKSRNTRGKFVMIPQMGKDY